MRSVRCEVCGTKALMAASQCPKCSHLFEVRDGFGELLPLAYCSACDSYYPEALGSCKWCGTKPEPAPIAPRVWKAAGIGALGVVLVIGWLLRDTAPKHRAHPTSTAQRKQQQAAPPADTAVLAEGTPVDTMPLAKSIQTSSATPVLRTVVDTAISVPNVSPPPIAPRATIETPPLPKGAVAEVPVKGRASARWVNSVAKRWVIVRAGPSKSSRIVASIGPDSRVQLGETRGTWRRVRSRSITGWVEPGSLFAAAPNSSRDRVAVSR